MPRCSAFIPGEKKTKEKRRQKHACVITIFTVGLAKSAELNPEHHRVQRGDRQHANTSL